MPTWHPCVAFRKAAHVDIPHLCVWNVLLHLSGHAIVMKKLVYRCWMLNIPFISVSGEWDHSYCRNPDASDKPWCFVAAEEEAIERQDCMLETCQGIQIGVNLSWGLVFLITLNFHIMIRYIRVYTVMKHDLFYGLFKTVVHHFKN